MSPIFLLYVGTAFGVWLLKAKAPLVDVPHFLYFGLAEGFCFGIGAGLSVVCRYK